jgi:hypothetical protein
LRKDRNEALQGRKGCSTFNYRNHKAQDFEKIRIQVQEGHAKEEMLYNNNVPNVGNLTMQRLELGNDLNNSRDGKTDEHKMSRFPLYSQTNLPLDAQATRLT